MVRKSNKGVSLVEVLMAIAIFMILMVPISKMIALSMDTTTSSKEKQYRNDFAQNLMEIAQAAPLVPLTDAYLSESGLNAKATPTAPVNKNKFETYAEQADATDPNLKYKQFQFKGTTQLGPKKTEYSYLVEISSQGYASKQANDATGSYKDPNNITMAALEDLDESKVALINPTFANYDVAAFDALLTEKMSESRQAGTKFDPTTHIAGFADDSCSRLIDISVRDCKCVDYTKGYDVICRLIYSENDNNTKEYIAYQKHFDKLENIYLLYNTCVYNDMYAKDYITFDLSNMSIPADPNEKIEKVKAFIIASADDYSADVKAAVGTNTNWLKDDKDKLYKEANGVSRQDNVQIGLACVQVDFLDKRLEVYHNLDTVLDKDKTNANVSDLPTEAAHLYNLIPGNNKLFTSIPNLGGLEDSAANRGLYTIRVYMKEGVVDETALKNGKPVLEGSRGGDEY